MRTNFYDCQTTRQFSSIFKQYYTLLSIMTTETNVKATGLVANKGIEFLSWATPNGKLHLSSVAISFVSDEKMQVTKLPLSLKS
jgi:hypothetical protein